MMLTDADNSEENQATDQCAKDGNCARDGDCEKSSDESSAAAAFASEAKNDGCNNEEPVENNDGVKVNEEIGEDATYYENMHEEADGWVYTDPTSAQDFVWSDEQYSWVARENNSAPSVPGETENSAQSTSEDESELKSDPDDEFAYQLKQERRERKLKKKGNPNLRVDDDGVTMEWDSKMRAWVPKITEDFIAEYQAHYGIDTSEAQNSAGQPESSSGLPTNDPGEKSGETMQKRGIGDVQASTSNDPSVEHDPDPHDPTKPHLKRKNEPPAWFDIDDQKNTNVYVSNLPTDITTKEFEDLMSKFGIIDRDLLTKELKMKLYMDENGQPKGDGRCCYIKVESVDLALKILDGYNFRGQIVHVERAKFQQKGAYDPSKRRKLSAKQKKKMREQKEKLFDWRPEKLRGERPKSDSVVVVKNLFQPSEFIGNETLIFDMQELLRAECVKYGVIKKIMVFDTNPEGVASIGFQEPEQADDCITMLDYKYIRGRQVRADRWDGKTKYKMEENEEEKKRRMEEWANFLESDEGKAEAAAKRSKSDAEAQKKTEATESA